MTVWKNCSCDIYYAGDEAELRDPGYEVRLDGDELVVSYEGDSGWVVYRGTDLGGGHYVLSAPEVDGRAVLHRIPKGENLEGFWEEGRTRGMWRVYLDGVSAS